MSASLVTCLVLFLACVHVGLCCLGDPLSPEEPSSDRKRGKTEPPDTITDPPAATGETPVPVPTPSGVLDSFLGPDVKTSGWSNDRYVAEGGGPVLEEGLLDCDFEGECCYLNAEPPEDKLQWQLAEGQPDTVRLEQYFATSDAPDGNYLLVASPGAEDPYAEARFVSCSIACTDLEVTVRVRHWSTADVDLQVCTRDTFFEQPDDIPLLNCKPLKQQHSAGPTTVTLPPGENFDVVFVARSFLYETGGVAMIDDIEVDYTICPPETATTEAVPTTPFDYYNYGESEEDAGGPIAPEEECASVLCNFESGDACAYSDASMFGDEYGATQPFDVVSGRFRNRLTGVQEASEGNFYLAAYLDTGDVAVMVTEVYLSEERVIRFDHYEATSGIEMRGCCDGPDDCPFSTPRDVTITDRAWKTASFQCPPGTTSIVFVCEDYDIHEGACALDNIDMFVADGGNPENANVNACEVAKR